MGVLRKLSAVLFVLIILVCTAAPALAVADTTADYFTSAMPFEGEIVIGKNQFDFHDFGYYPHTMASLDVSEDDSFDVVLRDFDDGVIDSLTYSSVSYADAFQLPGFVAPGLFTKDYVGFELASTTKITSLVFNFKDIVVPFDKDIMRSMFWVEMPRSRSIVIASGFYEAEGELHPFEASVMFGSQANGSDCYSAMPEALYSALVADYNIDCKYICFTSLRLGLGVEEAADRPASIKIFSRAQDLLHDDYLFDMDDFLFDNGVKYGVTYVSADLGEADFIEWAVKSVGSFLSLQVGPFTLGGIISTFIGIALFLAFLKYFKG